LLISDLTMRMPSGEELLLHIFQSYRNAGTRTANQLQLDR
jgi:hypothetical protein